MQQILISQREDRLISELLHGHQPSHFDYGAEFRHLEEIGLITRVTGVRWAPTALAQEAMVEPLVLPITTTAKNHNIQPPRTVQRPLAFAQTKTKFGPIGMIGRALLRMEEAIRDRGVSLKLASMDRLLEINKQTSEGWLPLISIFDSTFHDFTDQNSFFIVGTDDNGEVVACQAARLFEWNDTNFVQEAESLRLFYQHPEKYQLHDEACRVTALAAKSLRGRVVFSGAAWLRKDYRRRGIFQILPRLCRAYAHTIWNSELTMTMMSRQRMNAGAFTRPGYPNVEWSVNVTGSRLGDMELSLQWIKTSEMLCDTDRLIKALCKDNFSELDI